MDPITISIAIIGGITAIISFISEIMACSKCEHNGIIDAIKKTIRKRKSKKFNKSNNK